MPNYVLSFRSNPQGALTANQEPSWYQWFKDIGGSIVEPGNRVGESRTLGNAQGKTVLAGYSVIAADNLDAAVAVAKGCPGLAQDGAVDVAEIIVM
jgi:hypothetical protein